MEKIEMKLSFTKDELQKFVLMTAIGHWVINGIKEKSVADFETVEQKVFQAAMQHGLDDLIGKNDLDSKISPKNSLDTSMMQYIEEYDEFTFWEELECSLTDRDMIKKYGEDAFRKMTFEERMKREEEFRAKYNNEFVENGVENIIVAKKQV